jgi:hypothetical protein
VRLVPLEGVPAPHNVSLAVTCIDAQRISVRLDDVTEVSYELIFTPCIGVRVTTDDCWIGEVPRSIVEVIGSTWLVELQLALSANDPIARFMDRARHFIVPTGDYVLEVATHGVSSMLAARAAGRPESG